MRRLLSLFFLIFLMQFQQANSEAAPQHAEDGSYNLNQYSLWKEKVNSMSSLDLQITESDFKMLDSATATIFKNQLFVPADKKDTIRLINIYCDFSGEYMKYVHVLSLKLAKMALSMAIRINDKEYQARAYAQLGSILSWNGYNELTINYTKRSLEISDSIGKKNFSYFRHIELAGWLSKDSIAAASEMQKAYKIAKEYETDELLGYYYGTIADAYSFKGHKNIDSALKYLNLNIDIFKKRNEPGQYGKSYRNIADIFSSMGKFDSALTFYNKAIAFMDTSNPGSALSLYKRLGNLELKKKNYAKAESLFKRGLEINSLNPSALQSMEYQKGLFQAYAGRKSYPAAYEAILKYYFIRDSMEKKDTEIQSAFLSAEYGAGIKNQQIQLLAQENEIQKSAVQRQQLIRNSILIASVLLIGFAALLFNRFQLKKKIEKQQAIIDERQRISRELHDDLGAQLSTAKMFLHSIKKDAGIGTSTTAIENSLSLIDNTIKDLRGIMDDLQTNVLQDKGYIAATEELVSKINQLQQINFTLTHFNTEKRLDTRTEHHLFRITQELINNSLKYARAKNVSINLLKKESKGCFNV